MNSLPEDQRDRIVELRSNGIGLRRIATIVGCNRNTVHRLLTGRYYKQAKQKPNPTGICECGCGGTTTRLVNDDKARGLKAGDHCRFIFGHWHAKKRSENPDYGKNYQRAKLRDIVRDKLVKVAIESGGSVTVEELKMTVAPTFRTEGISRMLNYGRELAEFGFYQSFPRILVRRTEPTRPRYERPEIPDERATEIPLLINRRGVKSLDAPLFDDFDSGHTFFKSEALNPLEILLLKEEQNDDEVKQRLQRIAEWNRWIERKRSAFYQAV